MYLKELEIQGFKSFAKKGDFRFTSAVTAVVGPNGSGKSNVAEAFRFALGEQSIKTLRGKRGEDLIWNGSPQVPKMNRASVKITFDNTSRFLSSDFDEVSIERVVHRDGVNQYLINGTQVRLKDVVELLAGANIGQSGHHIISQGEADRILSAPPRERKIMLEEALGLKIYHYKKDESIKKLEKTDENIVHVEGLRKEIVPHLRFLKKQVEKVEKAESLRVELDALYREYLHREEIYVTVSKELLFAEEAGPAHELGEIELALRKAKEVMLRSGTADAKSTEIVKLEEALSRVREQKGALSRDLGKLEGQIELVKKLAQRREAALTEGSVPVRKIQEAFKQVESELQNAESSEDIAHIRSRIQAVRVVLNSLLHTETGGESQADSPDAEVQRLSEKLDDVARALAELVEEEKKLGVQYDTLKRALESEKDENRAAERAVFELMAKKSDCAASLARVRGKLEALGLIEAEWKREVAEAAALVGRGVLAYKESDITKHGAVLSVEAIAHEDRQEQELRKKTIERIKIRLEEFGAGASEEILKEYREVSERDQFLEREIGDLGKSAESLKALIIDLDARLTTEFNEGLIKINKEFSEFFALMFGGGSATLSVVKEKKRQRGRVAEDETLMEEEGDGEEMAEEDAEEGIEISVNLPRKRIKSLLMLSGGERALTSIALIFAMSQVNPPPFVILDETDAALDEANSKRYGDMLENLAKKSQLIVITHNRETMGRAGILYGVTMGSDGVSKLLSVKFEEAVAVAK